MAEPQLNPKQRAEYEKLKKTNPAKAKAYRDGIIAKAATSKPADGKSATTIDSVQGEVTNKLNPKQRAKFEEMRKTDPEGAKRYREGILNSGRKDPGVDGDPITIGGDSSTPNTNTGGNTTTPPATTDGTTPNPILSTPAGKLTNDILGYGQTFGDDFANKYISKDTFGLVDPTTNKETQDILDMLKQRATEAYQYSTLEQEAIDQQRRGLAGYASPEVQAMREQAQQEINRQYRTQLAGQLAQAQRFGVRGGGLMAMQQDNSMMRGQAQGNLERDLVIKNAEEQQARRNAFSNLITSTEAARAGRGAQMTGMYSGAGLNEEAARRGREQFNIGQNTLYDTTRSGLALTGAGLATGVYTGQQAIEEARKIQQQAIDQQNKDRQTMIDLANKGYKSAEKIAGMSSNSGGVY